MTETKHPFATQNEGYGFYGTMCGHAETAWLTAMTTVADATGEDDESVRAFLDSRYGRYFADEVHNKMHGGLTLHDAIGATTKKWMDKRISKQINRDYGIPTSLPYLVGFVIFAAFQAEEFPA